MNDAYEEHLFDASDVCRNCLRRIRVERVDPVRSGMGVEYEATMIDAEGPAAERLVDGAIGARPSTTGNRG